MERVMNVRIRCTKKSTALLMAAALVLMFTACRSKQPASVTESAETECAYSEPTIVVDQVKANAGDTVVVRIQLKQSPGIAACRFLLEFDNANLELQTLTYGPAFAENAEEPERYTSPTVLTWSQLEDVAGDQLFAELTFRVSEDAKLFSVVPITVRYTPADLINLEEEKVLFSIENGAIEIVT